MNLSLLPFPSLAQPDQSVIIDYAQGERLEKGVRCPEGKSRLRGPIPPDPGYGHEVRPFSAPCGIGHVLRLKGSDAKAIYKRATASQGAPFQLHVQTSNMYHINNKTGKPPKNHLNENLKRIRRIMRETQKRQEVKSQSAQPVPVKALWQSQQYNNVQSKVKQKLEEDNQRSSARSQSVQGNFLRAHANTGPEKLLRSSSVASSIDVPTTKVADKTKPDYVKINSQYVKKIPQAKKAVSEVAVKEAKDKQEEKFKNYQEKRNGRVPNYIEKLKEKRGQEISEARAKEPDPDCPPAHIKVDSKQRVSTLQQLKFNRTQLEKRLNCLPVHNDTVGLQRTKGELEKKIVELDEAIEVFSKPKVFLKIDE